MSTPLQGNSEKASTLSGVYPSPLGPSVLTSALPRFYSFRGTVKMLAHPLVSIPPPFGTQRPYWRRSVSIHPPLGLSVLTSAPPRVYPPSGNSEKADTSSGVYPPPFRAQRSY